MFRDFITITEYNYGTKNFTPLLCTCHYTEVSLNAYTFRGLMGNIFQAKCVHAVGVILFDNLHHS